ncbi:MULTISPECIES: anti-sigma factor antagonist [unclassified Streptomyces]|uniref:anti-sigma factor antagonist n=1 Tax=unclassified Streptomyces TaxID=2593676 RepID=UPI000C27DA07|nr:anti-sigma factor antagonist [Streptomyces sp. CB01201]PJN03749.1 STAS domain-containing protein [Streptomyces sp. CB01201]
MGTTADLSQGYRVIRATGELDILTTPLLAGKLAEAQRGNRIPYLVADLTDVTFMDCTALGPLCTTRARCLDRTGWLRLVYSGRAVGLLLRAVDLTGAFPRYATVDAARQGVASAGCH